MFVISEFVMQFVSEFAMKIIPRVCDQERLISSIWTVIFPAHLFNQVGRGSVCMFVNARIGCTHCIHHGTQASIRQQNSNYTPRQAYPLIMLWRIIQKQPVETFIS